MADRLARLMAEMRARDLTALALVPGANLRYLTGLNFHLSERLTAAFFPLQGEPAFVLPAMEVERAREESAVPFRFWPWEDATGPHDALQSCVAVLRLKGGRVAVEYTAMRVQELRGIEDAVPGLRCEDATALMASLRRVKDADEVAAMTEAGRIIDRSLEETIQQIRPGMSERELAAAWEAEMRAAGSEGPAFTTIIASGPNSAHPHHNAGDRRFQAGDLIILDGGATCGGYASDITRTVALGEPGPEAHRIYELVLRANAAGVAACRPGATGEEIDAAARGVIAAGGYGHAFLHRTGHGLGLECHEPPNIMAGSREPLPPGATFTVEPGIYLPGVGGVRIEDDVLLTPDGARCLTGFSRGLLILPASP